MRKIIRLAILCGLALCWNSNAASAQSQAAEEAPKPEVFTGTVIGIGGRGEKFRGGNRPAMILCRV